jgi:hypothetical protein
MKYRAIKTILGGILIIGSGQSLFGSEAYQDWFKTPQEFHKAVEREQQHEEAMRVNALEKASHWTRDELVIHLNNARASLGRRKLHHDFPPQFPTRYCCKSSNHYEYSEYPREGDTMFYRLILPEEQIIAIARARLLNIKENHACH